MNQTREVFLETFDVPQPGSNLALVMETLRRLRKSVRKIIKSPINCDHLQREVAKWQKRKLAKRCYKRTIAKKRNCKRTTELVTSVNFLFKFLTQIPTLSCKLVLFPYPILKGD